MVRPNENKARSFASIAINLMLVLTVAAGTFYAIAPVVA